MDTLACRIISLAAENTFLQDELAERHWQVCQEYYKFIRANREFFDPSSEVGQ